MLKHNFVFAVSLVAMFIVGIGSARADVVSTTYVDDGLAAKFNKTSSTTNAIVTTDGSGNVAPVAIVDNGSGTYVTDVTVSGGKVTLSRGTPSIPTVNNATLTIKQNGTSVGTFTANAASASEVNITVPTGALASKSTIVNADVADNAAIAASKIAGLATVATSGSYNDLSNKPTIPTVNNATLTIKQNGTSVGTFTANASSNKSIDITVPTGALASKDKITNDDVADDAAIATSKISGLATVATSGSYSDLSNKPTIPSGALASKSTIVNADVADNAAIAASKIAGLATVATSGSYNDLSNKPTIPTVNNATLTIKNGATNTNLATFTANSSTAATATIPAAKHDVAGLAMLGVIPAGADKSGTATIWVE